MESCLTIVVVVLALLAVNYVTKRRRSGAALGRQIKTTEDTAAPDARPFSQAEEALLQASRETIVANRRALQTETEYAAQLARYNEMLDHLQSIKLTYQHAAQPDIEPVEQLRQSTLLARTALVEAHLEAEVEAFLDSPDTPRRTALLELLDEEGVYATDDFMDTQRQRIAQAR